MHVPVRVASNPDDLVGATKLVLPGVGAFDHAMHPFDSSGLRPNVEKLVIDHGIPVLGVCVGMQMLAEFSDEGKLPGLGWINAQVRSLRNLVDDNSVPLPHMGWNDISLTFGDNQLFKGLEKGAKFYFLHSYYFECDDTSHCLASANYGKDFCCSVAAGNILGTQFHPEKSHHYGTQLLKNFADL